MLKNFIKLIPIALVTMGVVTSCTNDVYLDEFDSIDIVSAPKVLAYSGDQVLNAKMGSRANQDAPYNNADNVQVKPVDVTLDEMNFVVEYFMSHQGKSDAVVMDFNNFYVQQVYYSNEDFIAADGSKYDAKGCVNQINTQNCAGDNVFSGNDEFNKCRYLYDSSSLDFWYNNTKCGYWSNNFKMVYIPGYGYYVGFDVEGQPDDVYPANQNMHITNSPDGWYYDRIIKIVPADENGNPLYPNDEGFQKPDGFEENVGGGSDDNTDVDTPDEDVVLPKNEVEVNLSASDRNEEYLESHLSIHVRAATDVEIFIPVPVDYYCEADDMAIVMKHDVQHMVHGGTYETTYQLKDSNLTVKLTVTYEENGIRITTDGINQDVIDWCAEKCNGDGITFEVWNYYNEFLTKEDLMKYLNQATVEFLDMTPDLYVNAFNEIDGVKNEDDCTVSIVTWQESLYKDAEEGEHFNGSQYNSLYYKEEQE